MNVILGRKGNRQAGTGMKVGWEEDMHAGGLAYRSGGTNQI